MVIITCTYIYIYICMFTCIHSHVWISIYKQAGGPGGFGRPPPSPIGVPAPGPRSGHPFARGRGFQNWSHFWFPFGTTSDPKMDPKIAPKQMKKLINCSSIFRSLIFKVLELFGCLLGTFLGFLRLSWQPWTPKTLKNKCFFVFSRFLLRQVCGSLKLLLDLMDHLGPFLGQSGPKMVPKIIPKLMKKTSKNHPKLSPPKNKNYLILNPRMDSKMV